MTAKTLRILQKIRIYEMDFKQKYIYILILFVTIITNFQK